MALSSAALTLVSTLRTELGYTDSTNDAALERTLEVASAAIAAYCGRTLHYTSGIVEKVAAYTGNSGPYVSLYSGRMLFLARSPIVSVTSVVQRGSSADTSGGTTIDSTTYAIRDTQGILYRPSGWASSAHLSTGLASPMHIPGSEDLCYVVTYVAGYVCPNQATASLTRTLPYEVEEACIMTAVSLWRQRGRYRHLEVESEENDEQAWGGAVIPGPAKSLLADYRRPS